MDKKNIFLGVVAITATATTFALYHSNILNRNNPKAVSNKQHSNSNPDPNPNPNPNLNFSEGEASEAKISEQKVPEQESVKKEKKTAKIRHKKNYSIIYLDMDSSQY